MPLCFRFAPVVPHTFYNVSIAEKKKQKPFSNSGMRRNKKNLGVNVNIALNSSFKFI